MSDHLLPESLKDHQLDSDLEQYWEQLALKWGEAKIIECTPSAAKLILTYLTLANRHSKKSVAAGICLFSFNRFDPSRLYLHRLDVNKTYEGKIEITGDGKLDLESTIYSGLDDLLMDLTLRSHIVHHRVNIVGDTPLDQVLHQNFDLECTLNYPPDYPPLLVHIAMANYDYATAAKILTHPFIELPSIPQDQNIRLGHLVETSVFNAINEDHKPFLDYLLERYKILDQKTYPLTQAIAANKPVVFEGLLKKCPSNRLSEAFTEIFKAAVANERDAIFLSALEQLPSNVSISPLESDFNFLASLFEKLGPSTFEYFIEKTGMKVNWRELLPVLVEQTVCSPFSYLPYYQNSEKVQPSKELKVKMVVKAMLGEFSSELLQKFLHEYMKSEELSVLLTEALKEVLYDKEKIELLLNAGAIPTAEHFEKLLKIYPIGSAREEVFSVLLSQISDLDKAKSTLPIVSAFGPETVKLVFAKFPSLATDKEFLPKFMSEMWKGSIAATDRLLEGMLSVKEAKKAFPELKREDVISLPPQSNFLIASLGSQLSIDVLMEAYLPRHQVDKISLVLKQKPDCIEGFWAQAIFSGYTGFEGPVWELLVRETFMKMDLKKQYEEIGAAFYYSHLQLASLWLKFQRDIYSEAVFKWLDLSLQSGNLQALDVFANHHLLFMQNEKGDSFLHMAAEKNGIEFGKRMKEYGLDPHLSNKEGMTPYNLALSFQNITFCKILLGEESLDKIGEEILSLPIENKSAWLIKAFLRSSSTDILQLITFLRKEGNENKAVFDEMEKFIKTSGTLIVRFPSPQSQREMYDAYGSSYQNYEEQQWMWGLECESIYQKLLKEYAEKEHMLLEILLKLSKVNADRKHYNSWRMGLQGVSLITHFCGRYFFFWQFTQKIYKAMVKDLTYYEKELVFTEEGYQILYPIDGETTIKLSKLNIRKPIKAEGFRAHMLHTEPHEVHRALPYLDKLLEEIENYKFPAGKKPESPPVKLKKKIAELFWLGCHLAVTTRGSSQYMLLLHRLLYDIHGYKMSPWSLRYIQPDCIAIPLPFSIFFEEYYDLLFD